MPLIAVNLSDKLIQEIRGLVEKGRYVSLESFVEIGSFNQLALERGATPAEIIARGHRRTSESSSQAAHAKPPPATGMAPKPDGKPSAPKRLVIADRATTTDVVEPINADEATAVFERLKQPAGGRLPPAVPMPESPEPGQRIFGQVNRLFPVKLVCRWLAFSAASSGHWPRFTAVSTQLVDDAGVIGSLLDQWDKRHERERGGELATALPRRKNSASFDRFLSQFIARITRTSEVTPGAVCQYDLARFDDAVLALTEQGIVFANLPSPILDDQDQKAIATLSADESAFLTSHIHRWVPTECEDMRTVLLAVQEGKATPSEVAAAVRGELPEEWTHSMVKTHVSGVIARLGDIRLLRRSWQGRNVRYELGEPAQVTTFLKS